MPKCNNVSIVKLSNNESIMLGAYASSSISLSLLLGFFFYLVIMLIPGYKAFICKSV